MPWDLTNQCLEFLIGQAFIYFVKKYMVVILYLEKELISTNTGETSYTEELLVVLLMSYPQ